MNQRHLLSVGLYVALGLFASSPIFTQEDDYEFMPAHAWAGLSETGDDDATSRVAEGFEGLDDEPRKETSTEPVDGAGGFDNVAPKLGAEEGPGGLDWDPSPTYRTRYKGGTDYAIGAGTRLQGNNWFLKIPYITYDSGTNQYRVRFDANTFRVYTFSSGSTWVGQYGNINSTLVRSGSSGSYTWALYDTRGKTYTFTEASPASSRLTKIEGLGDPEIALTYTAGSITVLQKVTATSGTEVRRFTYTITSSRLDKIDIEEWVTSAWVLYRKIDFTYPEDVTGEVECSGGDLIEIKEETLLSAASTWLTRKWVYKYFTGTYNSSTNPGYPYQVKAVIEPQSVHDYEVANPSTGIHTQTASQLASYVDRVYEYASDKRVRQIDFKSSCGCGASEGIYGYAWDINNGSITNLNTWAHRVTITLPSANGSSQLIDFNKYGQKLNHIAQEVAGNSSSRRWIRTWAHNTTGCLTDSYSVKACTSYSDSTHAVTTNTTAGMRHQYTYGLYNELILVTLRDPSDGDWLYQRKRSFDAVTSGSRIRFVKRSDKVYPDEETTDADFSNTTWAYTYHSGDALSVKKRTTTMPVVATGENGSGSAVTLSDYFSLDGLKNWSKDGDGFVHYTGYDGQRRTVTKTVRNIDTDTADRPSGVPAPPSGEGFDSSTGLNIVTDFEYDYLRRPTKQVSPAFNAWDGSSIVSTSTTKRWWYTKLSGGESVTIAYPHLDTAYLHAALSLTVSDFEGNVVTEAMGSLSTSYRNTNLSEDFDATQSSLQAGFKGQITQRTDSTFTGGKLTQSSVWSDADDTNAPKHTTTFTFNSLGQREKHTTPAGTITKLSYDVLGRTKTTKIGTIDGGGSDNMTLVEEQFYDDEEDTSTNVGEGNLTRLKKYTSQGGTARTSNMTYDYRRRLTQTDEPLSVQKTRTYDNLNRVKIRATNDTTSGTTLMEKNETFYDALGRIYEIRTSGVSGGSESGYSNVLTWRNGRGLVVKTKSQGKILKKAQYDGAGRRTNSSVSYDTAETAYGDADDLTGDTVIEETRYVLDANGSAEVVGSYQRRHDGTGTAGLTVGSSGNGRAQYTATWHDKLHRVTHSANYGTNGGPDLTSRPSGSPPSSSDSSKLLTKYIYFVKGNGSGEPTVHRAEVVDPEGRVQRTESTDASHTSKEIENYIDGTSGIDDDRIMEFTFDSYGRQEETIAKGTGADQHTLLEWGIAPGVGNATVASNDVPHLEFLPDPSTGAAASGTVDCHMRSINAQMEPVYREDPYDTSVQSHVLEYDDRGRLIHDRVTNLPSGFDGSVRRISYTYDALDRPIKVTSHDNATVGSGSVVNELQLEYTRYNQVLKVHQAWSGAVTVGTSPKVEFAYSFPTDGTTGIRRTSATYTGGTVVTDEYKTGIDDTLSRLSGRKQGGSWLFQDSYLGFGRLVEREFGSTAPTAKWTLVGTDSGNQDNYLGLDRFGRIDDLIVVKNGTNINRYQYTYNFLSQATLREDLVGNVGGSFEFDETFTYDALRRLTDHKRGAYSAGSVNPIRLHECWTLNRSNGATKYANNTVSDCTTNETTFTFNYSNEITLQGSTSIDYDHPGNRTGSVVYDQVYDAWNRLVEVKDGSTTLSKYAYSGLHWEIKRTNSPGLSDRYFYYNDSWQMVEEKLVSGGTLLFWYVWGSEYIDDIVVRHNTVSPEFAVHDANFNVVTRLDSTGAATVRYCYDGYGLPKQLSANWSTWTSITVDYHLAKGLIFHKNTAYINNRMRALDPATGSFLERDPIGSLTDRVNLGQGSLSDPVWFGNVYVFYRSDPINGTGISVQPPLVSGPRLVETLYTATGWEIGGSVEPFAIGPVHLNIMRASRCPEGFGSGRDQNVTFIPEGDGCPNIPSVVDAVLRLAGWQQCQKSCSIKLWCSPAVDDLGLRRKCRGNVGSVFAVNSVRAGATQQVHECECRCLTDDVYDGARGTFEDAVNNHPDLSETQRTACRKKANAIRSGSDPNAPRPR